MSNSAQARQQRIEAYVEANRKSAIGAFLLAVFFGPVGVLYASPLAGAIMILIALGSFASGVVIGATFGLLIWVVGLVIAPVVASGHADKVRATAELITPAA
jgi:hypothetical protein